MSYQEIDESDIAGVVDVLRSGRLSLGPKSIEFEEMMAGYLGVKHAVAVNSGTAALHLIVKALGIGAGDEVIVPSFTFVASVNALLYEGAKPVFVDIEPETYNMDVDQLEACVTKQTKAIMVVDIFGHPAEWNKLTAVADQYGLKLIDDSCEALGAEYYGKKLGQFGDASAFAFYPNKQMTTGEGGMIVTNNDALAMSMRSMRNQGRGSAGGWLQHNNMGYNYRLDEMSAALGASQLKRLDQFLAKRENVAKMYSQQLSCCDDIRCPVVKAHVKMSWFVYVVTLAEGLNRAMIAQHMLERGVPTRDYFFPVHMQKYFKTLFPESISLPVTDNISQRALALPFHNDLRPEEIEYVVSILKEAVVKVF